LEKHKLDWARTDIPAEQNASLRTLQEVIKSVPIVRMVDSLLIVMISALQNQRL